MKEYLKQKYYWWRHLFWCIKMLLKYLILFDEEGFMEIYYWTKIHLTYKSRRIK